MKKSFAFIFAVLVGGFSRVLLAQGTVEPTVTIYATDANASEAGLDPGTFTVRRDGSTNFTVIVYCQKTRPTWKNGSHAASR